MDKQAQLDQLFSKAKLQDKASSYASTKELFINSVGIKQPIPVELGKTSFIHLNFLKIMIGLSSILGIGLLLLLNQTAGQNNVEKIERNDKITKAEPTISSEQKESTEEFSKLNERAVLKIDELPLLKVENILNRNSKAPVFQALQQSFRSKLPANVGAYVSNENGEDEYRFPLLTADEIKANEKEKKRMVKMYNPKKPGLIYMPANSFIFEDNVVSVQSFRIMQTEVSNLQYRTFLFDLLIQDRKEEFLQAKPEQNKWTQINNSFMEPMKEMYFSHPAYDDYPVVNVSIEGAQLYCNWLTENVKKEYPEWVINDFRIPEKGEWMSAATAEGKNTIYPWGTDLLLNESGCFLANFNYRIADSVFWQKERRRIRNPKIDAGKVYKSDGAMCTAKVISYNPNERGLYNVSGNVAELVYIGENKEVGTCGGGWMNSASEIKLNAPDPHKGKVEAHPNIGFRVVQTYLGQGKRD